MDEQTVQESWQNHACFDVLNLLIALAAAFAVVCPATARLFIWPDQGVPSGVDAIVMLDGPGDALDIAVPSWPYQIVYEWGALIKALAMQSGC